MKAADLTREQAEKLLAEVEPMLGYLSRLSARMDKRGMGTEPLAADVRRARDAMQGPTNGASLFALRRAGQSGKPGMIGRRLRLVHHERIAPAIRAV